MATQQLTRAQVLVVEERIRSNKGITLNIGIDTSTRDVTLEWLPKWSLTHLTLSSRRGESFNLRIHPDGEWCLYEDPKHHPKHCPACRGSAEMNGYVRTYPELVAPPTLGKPELDRYWSSLLAERRTKSRVP